LVDSLRLGDSLRLEIIKNETKRIEIGDWRLEIERWD